jgi:lysyl endopeptidase
MKCFTLVFQKQIPPLLNTFIRYFFDKFLILMIKNTFLLFTALLFTTVLFSQVSKDSQPTIFKEKIEKTAVYFTPPPVNNSEEIEKETQRQSTAKDKMFRFGKDHHVSIDIFTASEKTILQNGDILYQFGIECKNAVSINLVFDQFKLANGVKLYFVDPINQRFDGAYTSLNNNTSNMLGTELLYTEKSIVEVLVPANQVNPSILRLGTIVHGYRNLNAVVKALNSSGSCEIDVNCPLGAGWEHQRNSVAMMVNGGGFCTGSLVNNTSGTIIPYFLTANHCGTNPGGWVFRFRWESPEDQADCGTPAPSVDGPSNMNINGGTLCANYAPSDFTLTLLNSAPDPSWGIYYNGWDRTDIPGTELTCLHHPAGDIKKISQDSSTAVSSAFNGGLANSHWRVPSWDFGVTEGGSSGSPLFNQNHRTVGQLHGGSSSCSASAANMNDDFGKFFLSWTGGGTNNTRLSNWLDPENLGADFIDGIDPSVPPPSVDAGISNAKIQFETICGGNLSPEITLYNAGTDPISAVAIHYGFDGALTFTYNWSGSIPSYGTETVTLPTALLAEGTHSFKAVVENSISDQNSSNDTTSTSFNTITVGEIFTLNLTINCYADENSWQVTDLLSQTVYASSASYSNSTPVPIIDSFCLAAGCYLFTLSDSYGDGLYAGSTCDAGSFYLQNSENSVVAELLAANSNFGFSSSSQFCAVDGGLQKIATDHSIILYPNPATTSVTISSPFSLEMKIEIMTITGQKVGEHKSTTGLLMLHSISYEKGVYLAKITTGKETIVKHFVIH